jgi:DNA-binding SARP family transcriptional activator
VSTLRVSLFGRFMVRHHDLAVEGLESRKVQELFAWLLLNRGRDHPRESLCTVLWPESAHAESRKHLRQTLWQLQAALRNHHEPGQARVLEVRPDWVRFDASADLWLDVAEFEEAVEQARGVHGRELDGQRAEMLARAIPLYTADLLEDWFQDWCLYERERLQNMYLAALDKLMAWCEAQGNYEAGVGHGELILRQDRARERTHRRLMRLLFLAGDRTGALRQYQRCVAALREELGVRPSRQTMLLYEQIRADSPADPAVEVAEEPWPLSQVLARLKRIEQTVAGVQHQLHQNIRNVERMLTNPD